MNQFITELDSNYELTNYRIKNDVIVMYIKSLKKILLCPYCNTPSNKVHSVYEREIQDLPIQHRKVILLVQTRKMFCTNPACTHTTFSEKHSFAAQKSTKTKRLTEYIIFSSTQISSVNAAKQLKMQGIKICKSSICTLLKKSSLL